MKKEDFKQKLENLELTQEKFAKLFGLGYSTVKGWKDTPVWVEYVLEYLELATNLNDIENAKTRVKNSNGKIKELIEKVQKLDLDKQKSLKRKKIPSKA